MKTIIQYVVLVGIFSVVFFSHVSGGLSVFPDSPTINDSIRIDFSTWLPNPGCSPYDLPMIIQYWLDPVIQPKTFHIDVLIVQLPGIWPQIALNYDTSYHVGKLPQGTYEILARTLFTPESNVLFEGTEWDFPFDKIVIIDPQQVSILESKTTFFSVVPEPCTLLLIGVGMLLGRRKQKV